MERAVAILVNDNVWKLSGGPKLIIHEDDHLLIVNKSAGWNTHSPAPYAGEGIYEWLKNREPRWSKLAIIHRLDKETSGVMVFSKTSEANRSLTQQFTEGTVRKQYVLQTEARGFPKKKFTIKSHLTRVGDRYASVERGGCGQYAETEFEPIAQGTLLARPRTGRTHQIRVHAAESGFPIRGDVIYGGAASARVWLHSRSIEFKHPATGKTVEYIDRNPFAGLDDPWWGRRQILFGGDSGTDAFRLIHGAAEGFPNLYVDKFGPFVLSRSPDHTQAEHDWWDFYEMGEGLYHVTLTPHVRGKATQEMSPQHVLGTKADPAFIIRENGVRYEINFAEGYSVGIFLDQRDNRRRLLTNYIAPDFWVRDGGLKGTEVLNTFAYTCAFSVCAAISGARVTSLDLSKKYLEWGKRNFELNSLNPTDHDFIYGDVFDWLKRFAKKQRLFDVVLLDPPTFSKSKESGLFRAEHDYARLVTDALKILRPGGTLFASSNAAKWAPEDFVRQIRQAIAKSNRKILREHYAPQPPDFPISKAEPGYLKTLWLKIT